MFCAKLISVYAMGYQKANNGSSKLTLQDDIPCKDARHRMISTPCPKISVILALS